MGVTVGDITQVTFNHPTLGSGVFFPKSAEDSTYDLGGFRSSDDANMRDGGGRMINQKNAVRPFFEVIIVPSAEEFETLNQLARSSVFADWTITHCDGSVHGISGTPVGDIQQNKNTGNVTLKVAGDGQMRQIS